MMGGEGPGQSKYTLSREFTSSRSTHIAMFHNICLLLQREPDFFGPNGTHCDRFHFRAQISLDFQGPPLPMALEMDVAASKLFCHAPYKH